MSSFLPEPDSFIVSHMTSLLLERLRDVRRSFSRVLAVTCSDADSSAQMIREALPGASVEVFAAPWLGGVNDGGCVVGGTEVADGFPAEHFDLVLCPWALVFAENPPAALLAMGRALVPDGLLLAHCLGDESFASLRVLQGGASDSFRGDRLACLTHPKAAGDALLRLGFALPVVDRTPVTFAYDGGAELLADWRACGGGFFEKEGVGCSVEGVGGGLDALPVREGGAPSFLLDFDLIGLHGWRAHASQPKPLAPGSAVVCLADVLG